MNDPLGMPAATAPTSRGLIRLALDHAIEHGYPVLLEGTFRDPAMVTGTATRFAEAGYRVEVVAVATPAPVSRLAAEERFLRARRSEVGRWIPPEAHETTLTGSPEVVAALEALPAVARMIELAASDPSADVRELEEQQAYRRIALKVAAPEPPGIVGRIGQTLRRSLPPYRPASLRDAPGHEPPSIGR